MWFGILEYIADLTETTWVFRVAVISFAYVLALTPPQKNLRSVLVFLAEFLCVMLARHILGALRNGIMNAFDTSWMMSIMMEFLVDAIVLIAYAAVCCRFSLKVRVIVTGSMLAVTTEVFNLSYIFGKYIDELADGWTIPVLVAVYALVVIFACVVAGFPLTRFTEIPRGAFLLLLSADIIGIGVTLLVQVLSTGFLPDGTGYDINIFIAIPLFVLYLFSLITYISVYMICDDHEKSYSVRMENTLLRASAEQLSLVKSNIAEMHMLRHDLKNKYAYMAVLSRQKQYDRIDEVMQTFGEGVPEPEYYVECGNPEIGAILTMESTKANACGQSLRCDVMLPSSLPIRSEDLCSVLTNLIDNALEANARYGISEPVSVRMYIRHRQLYICVKNRLPEGANAERILRLRTEKKDRSEHGFGVKIVRRTAERYGGEALFDIAGGEFVAEVLFDMQEERGGDSP